MLNVKKIKFEGWKNCLEIAAGDFRIIAATEIGPRIIGGFLGDSKNIFYVDPASAGTKGSEKWIGYGGHRLWHSPEAFPRTYTLDNSPVEYEITKNSVILHQPADQRAGIEKSIEIIPGKKETFRVIHTLTNRNAWPVKCSAWALSMMAPGGIGILPMPQGNKKALLPNTYLALWPYNDMSDGRCVIGSRYTTVRQDVSIKNPLKIGYNCEDGWIAYQVHGVTFIKKFDYTAGGVYPDNGCSVECYTCPAFQEMETLSPLRELEPGGTIVFTEEWHALKLNSPMISSEKEAVEVFG